jgi:putative YhbY family RNA-binding protein
MATLKPSERRALRAKAHHLDPVVAIGQHGLTAPVLHEIDVALLAHELIKIRVFSDARDEREALLARICTELDAAAVQHLGKVLVVWRRAPETEPEPAPKRKPVAKPRRPDRAAAGSKGTGARDKPASGKTTQERRRAPSTGKGPFEQELRPPRQPGESPPRTGARGHGAKSKTAFDAGKGAIGTGRRRPRPGQGTGATPAPGTRRRRQA